MPFITTLDARAGPEGWKGLGTTHYNTGSQRLSEEKQMTTSQTGSYWLCPGCRRHVPNRVETCRCGFNRQTADAELEEYQRPMRASAEPPAPGPRKSSVLSTILWIIVAAGALAGSIYVAIRIKPPEPARDSKLARMIRESRERQVDYVPQPPPQPQRPLFARQPSPVRPPAPAREPRPRRAAQIVAAGGGPDGGNQELRTLADSIYRPRITAAAGAVQRLEVNVSRYKSYCMDEATRRRVFGEESSRSSSGGHGTIRWRGSDQWSRSRTSVQGSDKGDNAQCRGWLGDILADFEQVSTLMDAAEREANAQNIPPSVQRAVIDELIESLWG
jgi:hypothetical protein